MHFKMHYFSNSKRIKMKLITRLSLLALLLFSGNLLAVEAGHFYSADFMDSNDAYILMDYTSVHVPSQDKTYYECIVWDTETGHSKLYFYDFSEKRFKAYGDNVQLPSNPLPNSNNDAPEYHMDYTSVHVPSQDKTYYECMVWDAETGASKLYFYSFDTKTFKAYEDNVQLPNNPLPQAGGSSNFMMDYTSVHVPSQDKTYYECMVWNPNSGESKLYYYDYTSKSFVAYAQNVQLPSAPVE